MMTMLRISKGSGTNDSNPGIGNKEVDLLAKESSTL